MSYLFGDSDRAAERLALLAETFEEPSRAFLLEAGTSGAALVVDLGCGPGYTTRLVAETLGGRQVVGIDASEAHVARARAEARSGCRFLRHDALELPWPIGPAELVYARFLLAHLPEPELALDAFASQLCAGGRLLLEEVEAIETEDRIFRRYLERIETVLAARGQCLFTGPRLDACAPRGAASRLRRLEVDPARAAALFALNWATLRTDPEVRARVGSAECDALARQLASLRHGAARAGRIAWELRQVSIER